MNWKIEFSENILHEQKKKKKNKINAAKCQVYQSIIISLLIKQTNSIEVYCACFAIYRFVSFNSSTKNTKTNEQKKEKNKRFSNNQSNTGKRAV